MIETIEGGLLTAIALTVAMFVALEIGHRLGVRALIKDLEPQRGTGAIEGAVFGLIGLILAFTFSGAQSRFDTRRAYIVEEANTISTTYDRTDLLPEPHRGAVKGMIRAYLGERIATYRAGSNSKTREAHRQRAMELQREVWAGAELGCRTAGSSCALLLLPSVNALGDIATIRMVAQRTHVPWIIIVLMCILATCGAALAGYALAARNARRWLHWILFVGALILTVYVILDLEFPRRGLIRLEAADAALTELRDNLK